MEGRGLLVKDIDAILRGYSQMPREKIKRRTAISALAVTILSLGLTAQETAAVSLVLNIKGTIVSQAVGGPLDTDDLADLIAIYPDGTPVELTMTIDRLGPTQGQVTSLSGNLDGLPITLFDFSSSTIPTPPGFMPNLVDFENDTTTVAGVSGDVLDLFLILDGPSVFGLPLSTLSIDLVDTTGTLFGPSQVDLFTDDIDPEVFTDSPTLGFLAFFTPPGGGIDEPTAGLSFTIVEVVPEPSSLALLVLGGLIAVRRNRAC